MLDSSFGVNGKVTIRLGDFTHSINLQGWKIIVSATTDTWPNYDFILARYTKDGVLDSTFGVNGMVTTDIGGSDQATAVLLQGEKIVMAGSTYNASFEYRFALVRYTEDGVLDRSFGTNGKVTTDFDGDIGNGTTLLLQGDKIVVADGGRYDLPSFALARYTKDGKLDSSFGTNGRITIDMGGNFRILGIALQEERLIAVGSLSNLDGTFGAVAAYQLEKPSAPLVSGFTLVNANTGEDIQELKESSVLDLAAFVNAKWNIRANTKPSSVGSVVFSLQGPLTRSHTENLVPYALFGDNMKGGYYGAVLPVGDYTLTTKPYSAAKGTGTKGTPLTLHFKVVYSATIVHYILVNAVTDNDIGELKEGDVIDLALLPPGTKLNIRANTLPSQVGSVTFALSGVQERNHTENNAPYALFANNKATIFPGCQRWGILV